MSRSPTKSHTGLRSIWTRVAFEQQADVSRVVFMPRPLGLLPVSRNERPVSRKKTSSSVGSDKLIDRRAMCSCIEEAHQLRKGGAAIFDIEA